MSRIKELPVNERPREKAKRFGISTLSNEELLAIIIRTGIKDHSALDLAHQLNSESRGLFNLFQKPYEALMDINGIGPGKALMLSACFELCLRYQGLIHGEVGRVSTIDLYHRYRMRLINEKREVFILVILNRRKEIIHEEYLYRGSEDAVDCPPLEIIRKVILHDGKSFYVIHNHPSGEAKPSTNDVYVTSELIRQSNKVKVPLEDHLIITNDGYFSFKDCRFYQCQNP